MLIFEPGEACSIHGVGLIAGSNGGVSVSFDTIDVNGAHGLIDGHSMLSGGKYNVNTNSSGDNLEIYDSSLNSAVLDNAQIGASNTKIARNVFGTAGQNNITTSSSEISILENNLTGPGGWSLEIKNARDVRVTGNYFDNSGLGVLNTGAIDIRDSANITICGNTFHRTGRYTEGTATTSHIFFEGVDDTVSLCGNAYAPGNDDPQVSIRPDYVYDAKLSSTLTNIAIADNPAPQNIGVFTHGALVQLGSAANPHHPKNYFTGLTLSNNGGPSLKVDIAPGEASDSTGSAIITNSSTCTVDLTKGGAGGLDTGPGTQAVNTTYYFFVISAYGGSNPNCMASASLLPTFLNAGSNYTLIPFGNTTNNSSIVFNVGGPFPGGAANNLSTNPLGGMAIGDAITGAGIPSTPPTTIGSLQSLYFVLSGTASAGSNAITSLSGASLSQLAKYMTAGNVPGAADPINPGSYITLLCTTTCVACNPAPCVVLSQLSTLVTGSGTYSIAFTGNYTITLNGVNASSDNNDTQLTIYDGYYRMVGALYTDGVPHVVQFSQDNDTFYLIKPVTDLNISTLGTAATPVTLHSVPNGIPVEALGRCVANNKVLVFNPSLLPTVPNAFPLAPGYDTSTTTAPQTAFSYRVYTNSSQQIYAQASLSGTSLECITDGWAWKRAQ